MKWPLFCTNVYSVLYSVLYIRIQSTRYPTPTSNITRPPPCPPGTRPQVLHTCVSRCLAPAQKCKTCLYSSSGCTACTNITDKIRYKDAHCYPCMHYAPE